MTRAQWKRLNGAMRRVMKMFAPPPRMTVSEWADQRRFLSPEASAVAQAGPVQWSTALAPYQREMMDVTCDPAYPEETIMGSSQWGKTEVLLNIIGYHIDVDPAPILLIEPTVKPMAEAISKDRIATMIRDTPCLCGKVAEAKSRDADNTTLHKRFPGGHLTIGGANSPSGLASRPIRIGLYDEVDRFPASAGKEGDPVKLGKVRTHTYYNRINVQVSSPTIAGISRIEKSFENSDQRRYFVECPHCHEKHLLEWKNILFEKSPDGLECHPDTAVHACPHCGAAQTDNDLPWMLAHGEWRKGRPEVLGHAGFHINELYSPWRKFSQTVKDFWEAKDDPELLKVWVNTALGEVWKEGKDIGTVETLLERRENYNADLVPFGGVVITAGVDVQDDRVELEVFAWGSEYENWSLEYKVFPGDPSSGALWKTLDDFLQKTYLHESGTRLRIVAAGVDTGHLTKQVYSFCKERLGRRIYALKGKGGQGEPLASRPSKNNAGQVNLYRVGVDTAKDTIKANLAKAEAGPGYCHFPAGYDKAYFQQLLSERPVMRMVRGQRVRSWQLRKPGLRNEALDCRVYAYAALEITNVDLNTSVRLFHERHSGGPGPAGGVGTPRTGRRMRSKGIAA